MSMATLLGSLPLLTHGGPWGEYWWIWRIAMVLFWIVLIGLFIWWMKRNVWRHHEPTPMERAQGILAERYARGEVDADEYRERMSQLH